MAGACLGAPIVAADAPADGALVNPIEQAVSPNVTDLAADLERVRAERNAAQDALRQRDADIETAQAEIRALREDRDALRARIKAVERTREGAAEKEVALRAELEQAIATTRRDRVTLAYNLGCVYKVNRQYDRAEREFLRALQFAPDDAASHFNLGILYDDHLEDRAKARKHYERFLELAPDDPDVPRVIQWLKLL